jgi:uncharacterized protein YjbI with pentapeptide repeats
MNTHPRRPTVKLLFPLALAALASAAAVTAFVATSGKAAKQPPPAPRAVQVEMMLNAERASWRPNGRSDGHGTLTLDAVDPRMAVMALAPRREIAVVPASMLGANWTRLFRTTNNKTNIIVALEHEGRRKLIAYRARLLAKHPSGRQLSFAVSPLKRGAHELDRLGPAPTSYEGVSLLVDPTITDQIKSMWDALVAFFAGTSYKIPPNPTYDQDGHTYFVDGFDPFNEEAATYKGPTSGDITSDTDRERVQNEITDAVGNVGRRVFGNDLRGWNMFAGRSYDGLALFDDTPGVFVDGDSDNRTEVTNSAIYEMNLHQLEVRNADVAALNLRGTSAGQVTIQNSAFDTVDVTGATLGSEAGRSSVGNSVFEGMSGNEATRSPDSDNKPDHSDGEPTILRNVDFTSVSFREVKLRGSFVDGTTFQGCGMFGVDFTGATIAAEAADPDHPFQPSFDNSILENVRFDRAELKDVSFRDADFSGGGVSFDGAVLRNVDFTGATGLQSIDWTKVEIGGPVYGLEPVASLLDLGGHPEYFRSMTFDGNVPDIDASTGFDVDPRTDLLIDPATGVRLDRDANGALVPVDPATREPLRALNGDPLIYDGHSLVDRDDPEVDYHVDYASGRLEYRR